MNKKFQEGVKIREHFSVLKQRDGENIGYSESDREGTTASSYINEHDDIEFKLEGNSPQGEQDTLKVCQILLNVLNQNGGNWSNPKMSDRGVDCVSENLKNSSEILEIQVVRASTNPELWKSLANKGQINNERISTSEIVSEIKKSIETKSNERTIPSNIRQSITLALDANRLSAYTLDKVVKKFHEKYAKEVISLGFKSIWIVGPREELTHRLDILPEESDD